MFLAFETYQYRRLLPLLFYRLIFSVGQLLAVAEKIISIFW
jgi:hypothetical protein